MSKLIEYFKATSVASQQSAGIRCCGRASKKTMGGPGFFLEVAPGAFLYTFG
jgi:hypothetical protein